MFNMFKWTGPVAAILAVSLATLAVTHAQGRTKKPMVLTGTDYAEIQLLSAKYSHAIDTCADDGYAYAGLYTADGVFIDMWSQPAIDAGGAKWQGREKLREISSGRTSRVRPARARDSTAASAT